MTIDQAMVLVKGMSEDEIRRVANTPLGGTGLTNEEVLEKAAITTAALTSAGALSDAQTTMFSTFIFDQTKLKNIIRTFNFRNDKLQVEKLSVFNRVLVPHAEATDPGNRNGVDHSKITLQPNTVMCPLEISDDYLLENLEGKTAEETILRLFGIRAGNNIEQLYISGNKLGPARIEGDFVSGGSTSLVRKDTFLALSDGYFLKALSGNVQDQANDGDMLKALVQVYKKLPSQFQQFGMQNLAWFMAPNLWANFQYYLAKRGTAGGGSMLGDKAILGEAWDVAPLLAPAYQLPLLDMRPLHTEHVVVTGTVATALQFAPIVAADVYVTDTTLGTTAVAAYIQGTDYSVNATLGTITRVGTGITSGATVKVTYRTSPQLLLTFPKNLLLGIGFDVKAEKWRDIYKQVDQWALSLKVDVNVEETSAMALGINIKDDLV
jgi:hypothetical protein